MQIEGRDMSEKTELRGLCPTDIVSALDALALSRGVDRTPYINAVLREHVVKELHRASVLMRATRGNPLLPDAAGMESK